MFTLGICCVLHPCVHRSEACGCVLLLVEIQVIDSLGSFWLRIYSGAWFYLMDLYFLKCKL